MGFIFHWFNTILDHWILLLKNVFSSKGLGSSPPPGNSWWLSSTVPDTRRIFQHHRDRQITRFSDVIAERCEHIYFCIIFTIPRRTGRHRNWEQILGFSWRDPHGAQPALEQRSTQPNLGLPHLPIVPSHHQTSESQQGWNHRERTEQAWLWQLFSDSLGHNAVGAWPSVFFKTSCLSRNVHTLVQLSSERLLWLVFMKHFMFSFSMKIQKLSNILARQRKIAFISLF